MIDVDDRAISVGRQVAGFTRRRESSLAEIRCLGIATTNGASQRIVVLYRERRAWLAFGEELYEAEALHLVMAIQRRWPQLEPKVDSGIASGAYAGFLG